MHRVLACVLSLTLVAASGVTPLLHTHAYGGHGHLEHRHGLSAHEHHAPPHAAHRVGQDDADVRLERCDPARHIVSFAFVSAEPSQMQMADAELTLPASVTPTIQVERAVRGGDLRDHGPPSFTRVSPRAPPLITLT